MRRRKIRLTKPPAPPAHLSELAAAHWVRIAEICVRSWTLREADLSALALLATALATAEQATALIDKEGLTVQTGAGGVKPHPGVRMVETARAQAIQLLGQFGLTPRSRRDVEMIDEDYG